MSILIKGMDKIPKDGADLVVKHDDDGKAYIKYAGIMGYSMELVELPEKHGRLIDGDELFKQMNTAIAMMSGMMKVIGTEDDDGMQMELKAYRDIRDGIKDCDTVIEAEGEE